MPGSTNSPPVDPTADRQHDDNLVLNELKRMRYDSREAFGRSVALNINNTADLAAHYPYSPERFRVFVNGTRQQIQYDGEPTEYEDTVDGHVLKPQAEGDVVTFETTEIFRYVVQYVIEWSAAIQSNQALQSGDVVTLGYGDADLENSSDGTPGPAADGWFWIWDSGLDADEVRLAEYRAGSEVDARVVTVQQALTDWTRRAAETNWYNVGASRYTETYTSEGEQFNDDVGGVSVDDGKGPEQGNKPLQVSVKAGSAGAGSLEVDVGSLGIRTLGDVNPIFRRKTARFATSGTAIGTADTWVPVYAIRIDPDRRIVNVQLTNVDVVEFSASGDVRVLAQAFDQSNLQDSGGNAIADGDFSTPQEHSAHGSVLESTSAVAQFPDSGGTIGTSASNPGGYQEGYGSLYTSGQGSKQAQNIAGQQAKRAVSERDVVVFLANATATGDVTVEYTTEQQW